MKITHVTTRVLRTPADNPLVVGLPEPSKSGAFGQAFDPPRQLLGFFEVAGQKLAFRAFEPEA